MVEYLWDSLNMKLKPANIRTSQGNMKNLVQLKQVMNAGFKIHYNLQATNTSLENHQYRF